MSRIEAAPTKGLSYSPLDAHYYDKDLLQLELERVYDICHGCRMCFNLCPSFPALFKFTDQYDGDVRKLTAKESDYVVDTCFQCKVCYIKCPYTADDGHEFNLDFPRLMARTKAIRVKEKGLAFREKMLSKPDLLGKLAGKMAWLVNLGNKIAPNRWLVQLVLGVHRHKILPEFHGRSFMDWFNRNKGGLKLDGDKGKVFYFPTCYVNYNEPAIGEAAVRVFAKNELTVACDHKQCCGMPALESGDVPTAQKLAKANIEQLLPYVRQGYKVLATNPTCSMMMRKEYPELVAGDDAKELAAAVQDPNEYLSDMRKAGSLNTDFKSTPQKVRYHVPCHLRAQNIGFRSRDMMRKISENTEVDLVAECCGHDGTWSMKTEYFKMSLDTGKKAFDGMKGEGVTVTDCPMAAIHFEQANGKRPMHPLQVLDKAYEEEGFPTKVKNGEEK